MKILVTGGAGFIGSNLVETLVKDHDVTVLDNFHTGSRDNLAKVKSDIQIIEGSCNDARSLHLDPDIIFHLGIPSSSPMYKDNPFLVGEAINGMIAIMELAKKSESQKVVFASSSSLYNGVPTPHREDATVMVTDYYTEARFAIERIAELYYKLFDVEYAAMRFFSVYGPHEEAKGKFANIISQFMWEMKKGNTPAIYGDGTQTRDFIFVGDVVEALIIASKTGTGIFNVGTGTSFSFNDVVDILNTKLGCEIDPIHLENPIKNYVMHTLADTAKMAGLGFKSKYSIEKGIDEIV